MKKITVREWKDLSPAERETITAKTIEAVVEDNMQVFAPSDDCSDAEFREFYGCSRHYAETTSWFVPSCYFEKNKAAVLAAADELTKYGLYDDCGREIYMREK
jgi:predicted Fe-S protein YdhL (DUF1289 family)